MKGFLLRSQVRDYEGEATERRQSFLVSLKFCFALPIMPQKGTYTKSAIIYFFKPHHPTTKYYIYLLLIFPNDQTFKH
ncbi:hypothetical protein ACSBR2_004146 [Camellia fascicularis]